MWNSALLHLQHQPVAFFPISQATLDVFYFFFLLYVEIFSLSLDFCISMWQPLSVHDDFQYFNICEDDDFFIIKLTKWNLNIVREREFSHREKNYEILRQKLKIFFITKIEVVCGWRRRSWKTFPQNFHLLLALLSPLFLCITTRASHRTKKFLSLFCLDKPAFFCE